MWPTYKLGLSHVWECMGHITELYGTKMPIRIGGTTQDRSAYDGEYDGYIYPDPTIELHSIYGPKFFDLISKDITTESTTSGLTTLKTGDYGGETTLGMLIRSFQSGLLLTPRQGSTEETTTLPIL